MYRMYISCHCDGVYFSFVQRNKRKLFNTVKIIKRKGFNHCYHSSKNIILKTAKTSKVNANCVRVWTYVSSFHSLLKNSLSKLLRIMILIISFLHMEIISKLSVCSLNGTSAFLKFIISFYLSQKFDLHVDLLTPWSRDLLEKLPIS